MTLHHLHQRKTTLTAADRGKIWKASDPSWMHFAWVNAHWRAYPCDPRDNPFVLSVAATSQVDGVLVRKLGFVEVGDRR
jgi:hypothetical protein